jgi:hypothetical protein
MNKVALKVVYDKLDLNNDGTLNVAELKSCEYVKTIIGQNPSDVGVFLKFFLFLTNFHGIFLRTKTCFWFSLILSLKNTPCARTIDRFGYPHLLAHIQT